MDKYTFVLAELKRRKKQLDVIASETGKSRRTLYNLISETYEPRMSTLDKVYEYLKVNQRKKSL